MTAACHDTDRAVLRVSGPEARDFLQGLVTNDVPVLADGPSLPRRMTRAISGL